MDQASGERFRRRRALFTRFAHIPSAVHTNTWSCLAYALAGFLILETRLRRPLGPRAANAAAFACLELFLAVTSAYFHAALTFRAEWYDVLVLYLVPGYLAAFNLWRAFGTTRAAAALALIAVASGLFLAFMSVGRLPVFIALVAFFLVTQWRVGLVPETDYRWLLRAVGTFGVALTIWGLDKSHVVCAPLSPWQGHAVWHVLCAGVVGLLFLHCDAMCQRPGRSRRFDTGEAQSNFRDPQVLLFGRSLGPIHRSPTRASHAAGA